MEKILRAMKTDFTELSPEELVDDYSGQIYKFCCRLTYSKEDAEDLFQETFLRAFEQLHKVNSSDNPRSFLFSTAVYLWKSRKRSYARRKRIADKQALDDGIVNYNDMEDSILAQEDTRIIRELVHSLPVKFKIPVILYYSLEMSLQNVAETLKLPVGTVKSRLHKARKIIKKGLVNNGYGE